MKTLMIPSAMRKFTNQEAEVAVQADNLMAAMQELVATHPGLRAQLMDEQGNIRRFVRIFLGEDDVPLAELADTPLPESCVVTLVPAIAGG